MNAEGEREALAKTARLIEIVRAFVESRGARGIDFSAVQDVVSQMSSSFDTLDTLLAAYGALRQEIHATFGELVSAFTDPALEDSVELTGTDAGAAHGRARTGSRAGRSDTGETAPVPQLARRLRRPAAALRARGNQLTVAALEATIRALESGAAARAVSRTAPFARIHAGTFVGRQPPNAVRGGKPDLRRG